jgi:hydrogenase maturation protein HypF
VLYLSESLEAPVLAAGGDLKNSAAYGAGTMVYLSPYAGDLENPLAIEGFEKTVDRIIELYKVRPERIVFDMHPGYHSRNWALSSGFPEKIEVQHHHAHILSVMAEHGLEEAIGISFDGTGYGTDGTIWGGEILHADRYGFDRLGSLLPFRLPGGEAAVERPGRTAYSLLRRYSDFPPPAGLVEPEELPIVDHMIDTGLNSPLTTSAGRLFDAAAALLGFVDTLGYEGEGPIKMEWAALRYVRERGFEAGRLPPEGGEKPGTGVGEPPKVPGFVLKPAVNTDDFSRGSPELSPDDPAVPSFVLDPLPVIEEILRRLGGQIASCSGRTPGPGAPHGVGSPPDVVGELSYLFHEALAGGILSALLEASRITELRRVCLGGGVFQNMLLRFLLLPALRGRGFDVYLNRRVSPGDGGLALGQAYVRRKKGAENSC